MSEEFESAVFEHLGPKALLGETMSLHEAFSKGWQAARELDAKKINTLELLASLNKSSFDKTFYQLNEANNKIAELEEIATNNWNATVGITNWLIEQDKLLINHEGDGAEAGLNIVESVKAMVAELESQNKVMREALEHADDFISNGIEFGYIRMPDDELKGIDTAHDTPNIIRQALALKKEG